MVKPTRYDTFEVLINDYLDDQMGTHDFFRYLNLLPETQRSLYENMRRQSRSKEDEQLKANSPSFTRPPYNKKDDDSSE